MDMTDVHMTVALMVLELSAVASDAVSIRSLDLTLLLYYLEATHMLTVETAITLLASSNSCSHCSGHKALRFR